MQEIEVEYEVYRFHKWWKNQFTINSLKLDFGFDECIIESMIQSELEKIAFKRDLGEIRNLTYKYIAYDKGE